MFLGWLGIGTGVILLYAAYRNRSPLDILTSTFTGTTTGTQLNPNTAYTGIGQLAPKPTVNPGVTGPLHDISLTAHHDF